MKNELTVLLALAGSSLVTADQAHWNGPARPLAPRQYASSPCAQVSASASVFLAASPSATPVVDGQLAYDCLNSVSLHVPQALDLFDSMIQYVSWQTDLNYLRDPPPGYTEPAVDMWSALDGVRAKIANSTYANEYTFQADLFRVFNLAHDGHFRFFPDLLTGVIKFARGVGLVSVSEDGLQIPSVYTHGDVILASGNNSFTPSAVTSINGRDPVMVLEDLSQLGALNDPDALYNSMFYSKAFDVTTPWDGYFAGSGRYGNIWPGYNTTLTFANGSSTSYHTTATVIQDFTGVVDGETFYQKFCTGPPPTSTASVNATTPTPTATSSTSMFTASQTPTSTAAARGYPPPVVISSDQTTSCYFLDGENSDVAVLALVSFEPDYPAEMQAVIQACIEDATAAGKTKMVIDLAANGGGYILNGYDAFRQFFPDIVQDGNTRFLESESFTAISEIFSAAVPANYSAASSPDADIEIYETPYNYRYDLNLTNQHYLSYEDKFAPHTYYGANYTNIIRWDLNDPLTTSNATYGMGMDITGYRSRANFTQPFPAENIIMLYDGYCASTCTLFSEFMRTQAGVNSIVMGGRPANGTIQAIGGVKGANNFGFSSISYYTELAIELSDASPSTDISSLFLFNSLADNRSTDNSINARDNILPANLDEGLPAQFVYEPADCRLFYTPGMIVDVSAIWTAAANAAWNGAPCVAGGLSSSNSTSVMKRAATAKHLSHPRPRQQQQRSSPLLDSSFDAPLKSTTWQARNGQAVPV